MHPTHHTSAAVDVEDLTVTISGIPLLAATSFRASPGEVAAVRGANGAGKTTLLRVLAGRVRPTAGTVRIGGRAPNERDPVFRRQVAAMIGLPPLASDLTVVDHVALVASTWWPNPDAVRRATECVLAELGLTTLAARFPNELSSGQTQLLGLALVLVRPSDVLLLDEPEQRLDADRVALLAQALRARRDCGATIVLATHSAALADRIANRTLTLASLA